MEYFTNTQLIKENTPINKNVDDNDIVLYTKICAERYIEPIIGNSLYNELLTKYNDPFYTLTNDEKEIIKNIEPVMNWYVAFHTTTNVTYPVKNKGIQQMNGDFSNEVDYQVLGSIRKQIQLNADFYENRLRTFMCKKGIHNTCSCGHLNHLKSLFFV